MGRTLTTARVLRCWCTWALRKTWMRQRKNLFSIFNHCINFRNDLSLQTFTFRFTYSPDFDFSPARCRQFSVWIWKTLHKFNWKVENHWDLWAENLWLLTSMAVMGFFRLLCRVKVQRFAATDCTICDLMTQTSKEIFTGNGISMRLSRFAIKIIASVSHSHAIFRNQNEQGGGAFKQRSENGNCCDESTGVD